MPTLEGAPSFSPSRQPRAQNAVQRDSSVHGAHRSNVLGAVVRSPAGIMQSSSFRARDDARDDCPPRAAFSPRMMRHSRTLPSRLAVNPLGNFPMSYIAWTANGHDGSNWRQHFHVDPLRRSGTLSTAVANTLAFSNPDRLRPPPSQQSPLRYNQDRASATTLQRLPSNEGMTMAYQQESVIATIGNHTPSPRKQVPAHKHHVSVASFKNPPLSSESKKRLLSPRNHHEVFKKAKGFNKLDLLCSATLEMGELHDNPSGCSCPKSKCIALYCDCFKAGRRCNPDVCTCVDCKNTIDESGPGGARTKAIRSILARNPRAFTTAGLANPLTKLPPGEIACNCVRSRCLKLYCSCFHHGKPCRPGVCTCVGM